MDAPLQPQDGSACDDHGVGRHKNPELACEGQRADIVDVEFHGDGAAAHLEAPTLWDRMLSELPAAVEQWSRDANTLNTWEAEHLATDKPKAATLALHRKKIERMMFWGQMCALVAMHPEYGDAQSAEIVTATQEVLRNKLRMYHQPMSRETADKLLAEVFAES